MRVNFGNQTGKVRVPIVSAHDRIMEQVNRPVFTFDRSDRGGLTISIQGCMTEQLHPRAAPVALLSTEICPPLAIRVALPVDTNRRNSGDPVPWCRH